ncbi:MAG: YncE family protein, partial [Gemmataceae bacterium]|nr:YncE family protein [Gemmataceae bacterium]
MLIWKLHPLPLAILTFALLNLNQLRAGQSNSLMDVSQDGKKIAVANTDSGTVTVFDVQSRKPLAEIPVGTKPEGVTWIGKSPLLAVTLYSEDKVVIIDCDKLSVVKTITTEDEPYGIVSTLDGKKLYVTHEYPGKISEINTADFKVTQLFNAGKMTRGIALSPDEKNLFVTEFYTAS